MPLSNIFGSVFPTNNNHHILQPTVDHIYKLTLHSDHNEQLWVWYNDGHPYYYDHHETVRFRIDSETWFDTSPTGPGVSGIEGDLLRLKRETGVGFGIGGDAEKESPYQIQASMAEEGMGPVLWWDVDEEEVVEE